MLVFDVNETNCNINSSVSFINYLNDNRLNRKLFWITGNLHGFVRTVDRRSAASGTIDDKQPNRMVIIYCFSLFSVRVRWLI